MPEPPRPICATIRYCPMILPIIGVARVRAPKSAPFHGFIGETRPDLQSDAYRHGVCSGKRARRFWPIFERFAANRRADPLSGRHLSYVSAAARARLRNENRRAVLSNCTRAGGIQMIRHSAAVAVTLCLSASMLHAQSTQDKTFVVS